MLEDDRHYGEKILRAFEKCCTGRGRPASIEASVFLLTSEDAGYHITSSCFLLFTLLINYSLSSGNKLWWVLEKNLTFLAQVFY